MPATKQIKLNGAVSPVPRSSKLQSDAILNYSPDVGATCAAPVPSLAAGSHAGTQSVELSSTTQPSEIYYTIDGSTPTNAKTRYIGAIEIEETTTLKAITIKFGMTSSSVFSGTYTIT